MRSPPVIKSYHTDNWASLLLLFDPYSLLASAGSISLFQPVVLDKVNKLRHVSSGTQTSSWCLGSGNRAEGQVADGRPAVQFST